MINRAKVTTVRTKVGYARNLLRQVAGAAALLFAATSSMGQSIVGTPHDFSARGWGSTQICIFCHTPHNGTTNLPAPLWNHAVTASTFTLYSSSTLNAIVGQPAENSKLCLSCHDGTVAIDSFGGRTGTNFMTGSALLGANLSNDHPVSLTYDAALVAADGGLKTPPADLPLFSSKVECATCHNVHNNSLGDFLRASNAASGLCLKCHNK